MIGCRLLLCQCFTHRYLGWKIHVHDSCDTSASASEPVASQIAAPGDSKQDDDEGSEEGDLEERPSIQVETRVRPLNPNLYGMPALVDAQLHAKTPLYILKTVPQSEDLNSLKTLPAPTGFGLQHPGNAFETIAIDEATLAVLQDAKQRELEMRAQQHQKQQQQELKYEINSDSVTSLAQTASVSHPPGKTLYDHLKEETAKQELATESILASQSLSTLRPTGLDGLGNLANPTSTLALDHMKLIPPSLQSFSFPKVQRIPLSRLPAQMMFPQMKRPMSLMAAGLRRPIMMSHRPSMYRPTSLVSPIPPHTYAMKKKPYYRVPMISPTTLRPVYVPGYTGRPMTTLRPGKPYPIAGPTKLHKIPLPLPEQPIGLSTTITPDSLVQQSTAFSMPSYHQIVMQQQQALNHIKEQNHLEHLKHFQNQHANRFQNHSPAPSHSHSALSSHASLSSHGPLSALGSSSSHGSLSSLGSPSSFASISAHSAQTPQPPPSHQAQSSSHFQHSFQAPYSSRPVSVHPGPQGFNPGSVIVEGGFKPIIQRREDVAQKRADIDGIDDEEEGPITGTVVEIMNRSSDVSEEDEADDSASKPFEGQQTETFEPIFVPSPPDRNSLKPGKKSTTGSPVKDSKREQERMIVRRRPGLVRRPLYPKMVVPPFKIPSRGNLPQFRNRQQTDDQSEESVEKSGEGPPQDELLPEASAVHDVIAFDGHKVDAIASPGEVAAPSGAALGPAAAALVRSTPQFAPFAGDLPPLNADPASLRHAQSSEPAQHSHHSSSKTTLLSPVREVEESDSEESIVDDELVPEASESKEVYSLKQKAKNEEALQKPETKKTLAEADVDRESTESTTAEEDDVSMELPTSEKSSARKRRSAGAHHEPGHEGYQVHEHHEHDHEQHEEEPEPEHEQGGPQVQETSPKSPNDAKVTENSQSSGNSANKSTVVSITLLLLCFVGTFL